MKLKTITAAILALTGASAYAASDFLDTAQVVSSTPIIQRVSEPRQECEATPAPQKNTSIIAPIIGGVLGGLLGHQVGRGSGQTAATIVGAAGGAVAGNMVGNRVGAQPAQQCRTVESSREVINGYNVVYRYNGRDVNVALPYDPGSTLKVGVGVVLDERAADSGRAPERNAERGTERYSARAERGMQRDAERGTERYSDRGLQRDAEGSSAANSAGYNYRY